MSNLVVLPFATPHGSFEQWGVFHPMTLMMTKLDNSKKVKVCNQTKDYSGYSSVKLASCLSSNVVAVIPPKTTIAGLTLDALISTFVDTENILTEVDRVELLDSDCSIANQVRLALTQAPSTTQITVCWPYQMFGDIWKNSSDILELANKNNVAFCHELLPFNRSNVAECVVVSVDEGTCKNVMAYQYIDEMLRGHFQRVVSLASFSRSDFEEFASSPDFPDMSKLLKKTLTGRSGLLVQPEGHRFI